MSSSREPSDGAQEEADALIDEQVLVAHSPDAKPEDKLKLSETEVEFRNRKRRENAFMQSYACQEYESTIFDRRNIWKFLEGSPEHAPTASERLRFERLFYQIYRLISMPPDRFKTMVQDFRLADMVRMENLTRYWQQICSRKHTTLAPLLSDQAESMLARLEVARLERAHQLGYSDGVLYIEKGYSPWDAWATYDELQDQIEWEFAEDPKHRPKMPDVLF